MGGFPIDLVLFGLVAAFLVLRLINVLGKRTGFEQPVSRLVPQPMPANAPPVVEAVAETVHRPLPDPTGPVLAQQSGDHQSAAVCSPSWAGHPGHECRSLPERRLWLIERSGRTPTNPLFWG